MPGELIGRIRVESGRVTVPLAGFWCGSSTTRRCARKQPCVTGWFEPRSWFARTEHDLVLGVLLRTLHDGAGRQPMMVMMISVRMMTVAVVVRVLLPDRRTFVELRLGQLGQTFRRGGGAAALVALIPTESNVLVVLLETVVIQ